MLPSRAAYIMVGWLPDDSEESETAQSETLLRCLDMLEVANSILTVLDKHRETTGVDLHGRIGVATGKVVSGVLGRLQPRFCVFGEAMSKAADLEATGTKGSVHCSKEFFDFLVHRGSLNLLHGNAFSADLAFQQHQREIRRTVSKRPIDHFRTMTASLQSHRVLQKMVKDGKLIVQQNMMNASPSEARSYRPELLKRRTQTHARSNDSPMGSEEGLGGSIMENLCRSINVDGNFPCWKHDNTGMLRKQIDEFGTLQGSWCGFW